jgi:hypothetical protein
MIGCGIVTEPECYLAVALNITNTGTTEKIVDIEIKGTSSISPESQYYAYATSYIKACLGVEYEEDCIDIYNRNETTITKTKKFRAIIRPGNHFLYIGELNTAMDSGLAGIGKCPSEASALAKLETTVSPADLSDGKKPTLVIYSIQGQPGQAPYESTRVDKID